MAESELFGLKDEITCPLCLDTLSDPVSIPCGHSFCLKCLTEYCDQYQDCRCPQCRRTFTKKPKLHINTALNGVIERIKQPRLSPHPFENYENMECDACIGLKSRAVKFCLTCMASYCQTHLKPHLEIAAWKDHKLTDPEGNLKEQLCAQHEKRLEMFCKNDEKCVCVMCVATGHNEHIMVELETERIEKQVKGTQHNCLIEHLISIGSPVQFIIQLHSQVFIDFCPLTLDWKTAQQRLHLSEGNKTVTSDNDEKNEYPYNPVNDYKREQILCNEALTGTHNVEIGVTYKEEDIDYKYHQSLLGYNDMSWCLWCFLQSQYFACHDKMQAVIHSPYSPRIGVYLDWPAGSLSFYRVSLTMTILHRFNTTFTKPLYPVFYIFDGSNVAICNLMP
uniref:Uncharacterized protein n=1 Tax=Erpetoichthys calabaricus TaxID=27687 RepID=A0A8C4RPA0_ERPCA